MKKWLCVLMVLSGSLATAEAAQKVGYLDEVYALGTVAGQGLACRAEKYDQFELLARAIVIGKSTNGKTQKEGLREFNAGKVDSFMSLADNNFAECNEIVADFDNQKIFQSTLYSDGRVKLYDGNIITPRNAYDASKLYKKDPEAFDRAYEAYKKYVAQAAKTGQNKKMIPLKDVNYDKFANQFD